MEDESRMKIGREMEKKCGETGPFPTLEARARLCYYIQGKIALQHGYTEE